MELVDKMLTGDVRSLARLMTLVENRCADLPRIMKAIHPHLGKAYVVGVTGPPGAGKSTLADKLIAIWRKEGLKIGAVLIDPSSPFTGGAILGDRIRMNRHACDSGVFMRSMGSRGRQGGLSRSTKEVVHLLDAFGVDRIIVETVGVGQTELDIMGVADTVTVILGPESGDTIQTIKAGLMEIADVFVVNKADRDGAQQMAAEIKAMLELRDYCTNDWRPPVLLSVASTGEGVSEIVESIRQHKTYHERDLSCKPRRRLIRRMELVEVIENFFGTRLEIALGAKPFCDYVESVEKGDISPYEVLEELLNDDKLSHLFRKDFSPD